MNGSPKSWSEMRLASRAYLGAVVVCGVLVLVYAALHGKSQDPLKFICYLAIALAASRLKVNLPGITGTMSVNFLFVLLGVMELSFSETVALGCAAIVVQCLGRERPKPLHIIFNVCSTAIAITAASAAFHYSLRHTARNPSALVFLAACVYFVANTLPVAAIISLTEQRPLRRIWSECYFWSFPYYLVGAGVAGMMTWLHTFADWQTSLLTLPVVYLIYRSYRLYLGKLADEKRHVEEIADLHLRTIEALALAIEAKDQTTHDHLQRVRVYASEVAKELKVTAEEMEALQAAALLHDIGKLAVPEHIVSKPGRLTPEEFEKMKIHPVVGAEILERVRFPYPVVPIVRAHHEKFDGTGYPAGLRGEEIPIGARILSAVDFLDALASDRQYRRALPMDGAMARLMEESGKAFDPQVVNVLRRKYLQLEQMVHERMDVLSKKGGTEESEKEADGEPHVTRGIAPAAGFARPGKRQQPERSFLSSIAAARQEAQTLFELSQDLGASLSLSETLSVFSVKLRRSIPYDAIAIYVCHGEELVPEYVNGDNFRLFASLRIPIGQGLSGWVAQNLKPILNGNPSVEPGYLNDPSMYSTLTSALAVPLEGLKGVVGVVALYHSEKDFFTTDHLRILLAVSSKMGLAIENALKYEQAESSAVTDYLTGLPNARSLFLQLDRELARCKRDNKSLTVMVSDLDGFKQINDRFGHLEGNRVLRLFAHSLKETSREYDYVARMGGDEFVVIAPGLTPEAAARKAEQMRDLAQQAGKEVCSEDILSLSVGKAVYPEDGLDAEKLLSEADKRMYLQKQGQGARVNRRLYPRVRGRLTTEIAIAGQERTMLGIVTNLSLGGCYAEASGMMLPGTKLKLSFSLGQINVSIHSEVVRMDMGIGAAIKFNTLTHEERAALQRILEQLAASEAAQERKHAQNAVAGKKI